MTPFKNHNSNPGFSFIEVMVALTFLAIFGSSLFVMQTNLFEKLSRTHETFFGLLQIDKHLVEFQTKVQQAAAEKKSVDDITLHYESKNPNYTIDIKLVKISEQSKLFKEFNQPLRIVQTIIKQGKLEQKYVQLMIIAHPAEPKPEQETEAKDQSTSAKTTATPQTAPSPANNPITPEISAEVT